jgi:hypothetical protein
VRGCNITDPFAPREVAHLYHPHPKRWSTRDRTARALIQSNDVYVAPDGLMYLTARRCHPCSRGLSAGAPPRLGKGHPSSAARRSDLPLTKLAPLSPRGRGAGLPAP